MTTRMTIRMTILRTFAAMAPLIASLAGCPAALDEVCGLPTTLPEVEEGRGTADRDGAAFDEGATWAPGPSASVTIGTLDLLVAADETGTPFDQLVEDGAIPFCVRFGERSETTMSANLVSDGLVTNASNTGGLAVLALEDNILVGRFEVDLSGGAETSFTDGAFRARRR